MAQQGIQTENSQGVEDLVKNVFVKGNCRNVSNIAAIGNEAISIGQYYNGSGVIGIEDGIILSTGDIELAHGPNNNNESGIPFNALSNDPDLSQLATDTLFDVTGIEFDFVPIDEWVTFRYVFASEEYCEYVTTAFNDIFGFFVSGPGINGPFDNNAINAATLSGTNENVSINTVNHLFNSNLYVSNVTTIDAENCDIAHSPLYQDLIEYDGFTVPLTATFQVIPCETYHIRLVLGDVGDAILDSAVFLESKSFDIGEKVNIQAQVPGRAEPIAYESCADGQFVFTRSSLANIDEECTIEFSISPESEAINGVDFLEIPSSVTIPAGDTSFILPITVIEDNTLEGPERLRLNFEYPCDCIDPVSTELIITEAGDLSASIQETIVCPDQPFYLTPEVIGGVPPFDFLWQTGDISDTIEATVGAPTQYAVTVTDFCGNTNSAVVEIDVQNIPTAMLTGDYDLCETISTGIPVLFEGNPPWGLEYSLDGVEQDPFEDIFANPFYLNTTIEGTYALTGFNDANCSGSVSGSALVGYSTFDIAAVVVPPSCPHTFDGSIEITQISAIPPFSFEWNFETVNDYMIENLSEGVYVLSIVDANGCLYEKSFDLAAATRDINECLPFYVPNSFSPNNDGVNDLFSIYSGSNSGIANIITMQVYNRWGALMYEHTNFVPDNGATGWNGRFNGKPVNPGVYVYLINVVFEDGRTLNLSGDITLLR